MDLQTFRNDEGTEDYFKSDFNLGSEEGDIEQLLDCLNEAVDWQRMEKGDHKHAATLNVRCVERLTRQADDPTEFEGDILLMFTYDAYPDDTIKMRYKVEGGIEEDGSLEVWDFQIFWFDHEGHHNPLDYSSFHEFFAAAKEAAGY
jgi:hypothetical protein